MRSKKINRRCPDIRGESGMSCFYLAYAEIMRMQAHRRAIVSPMESCLNTDSVTYPEADPIPNHISLEPIFTTADKVRLSARLK